MTNQRFIALLRDYAAVARRKRVSYAAAVAHLVELRQQALEAELPQGADLETGKQLVADIAKREYGKFDDEFAAGSDG